MDEKFIALLQRLSPTPTPCVLRPKNVSFIVEIQFFLEVEEPRNFSEGSSQVAFAITSDGHRLLVDTSDDSFMILQEEFGDIDKLGITLSDLAEAEKQVL